MSVSIDLLDELATESPPPIRIANELAARERQQVSKEENLMILPAQRDETKVMQGKVRRPQEESRAEGYLNQQHAQEDGRHGLTAKWQPRWRQAARLLFPLAWQEEDTDRNTYRNGDQG